MTARSKQTPQRVQADTAQSIFDALAHPSRREILLTLKLRGGSMGSGDIADRFSCSWPTTSRHLHVLEAAGLIAVKKQGRSRTYQLKTSPMTDTLGEWLAPFKGKSKK